MNKSTQAMVFILSNEEIEIWTPERLQQEVEHELSRQSAYRVLEALANIEEYDVLKRVKVGNKNYYEARF